MTIKPMLPGVIVSYGMPSQEVMDAMDAAFNDWTMQAARGECSWICADCCQSFPKGMPEECCHGHRACTEIIQRDKRAAAQGDGDAN